MVVRRLLQLTAALTAHISVREHVLIATFLEPGEQYLFERMPLFDRRHCLDVYHTLVRADHTSPHLLKAALLHDCGKVDDDGRPIPLLYYGVFVLMKALMPKLYWWAVADARGPLRPFRIHAQHDERSARLVEYVGGDPELVAILRDYGGNSALSQTRLLAWADKQN